MEGCVPRSLERVRFNDYLKLGLPLCSVLAAPTITTLIVGGADSLIVGWATPIRGPAVIAYDLRYIRTDADETVEANWTVVENIWAESGPLQYVLTGLATDTAKEEAIAAVADYFAGRITKEQAIAVVILYFSG